MAGTCLADSHVRALRCARNIICIEKHGIFQLKALDHIEQT
jgi:hypothetical protein